jgi:hypothetical protein
MMSQAMMSHRTIGAVVVAVMLLGRHAGAQEPAPSAPPSGSTPGPAGQGAGPEGQAPVQAPGESASPAADPGATAAGALAFFMNSRDYRTLRELKSILTESARATYEHDSVAYNGKKGIRLAAFDYREPAPKGTSTAYAATVKTLWDDQGEAVEQRTETVRLTREGGSGAWRVAGLARVDSQPLRFKDATPGVTTLRMVLRAWVKRDVAGVKSNLTDAFVKKLTAKGDTVEGLVMGDAALRHAAFRIDGLDAKGETQAAARVRLVESHNGRPGSLDGSPHTLTLVKKGSRWLVDDWK